MKRDYSGRKFVIGGIFIMLGIIFIARLFYLQIIEDKYVLSAQSNVVRKTTLYPSRGHVYDRNNNILVHNEVAYDVIVVPKRVKEFDTLSLSQILGIEKEFVAKRLKKAKRYSYRKSSVFLPQISKETYAYLEEKLFKFPGFSVQTRSLRKYPRPIAANTLGYVGEVNSRRIKKDNYYRQGDYVGISGLESKYEKSLRGKKGERHVLVDVYNREMGSFQDGRFDTAAIKGQNIYSTLDADLQEYGELLMKNKIGSIVAIEPSTGEILSLITSPGYDPNELVGRIRGKNYLKLSKDPLKPLFNRALMAQYPPGSTFKLVNALIALQEGVIRKNSMFSCQGVVSRPIKCSHNHKSPLNLEEAIEMSCNTYFWKSFDRTISNPIYENSEEGYNVWREYVLSLGLNNKFNTDLAYERSGFIPNSQYYDKYYKKGHWNALTVRSLSIGQGEILVTPLQLANFTVIMANRGFYYPPHLVKSIGTNNSKVNLSYDKKNTLIDKENYDIVVEGMERVFTEEHGTARWYALDSISMCGKTGTVQNPHGKDHSIFIVFAPKDNPKIALSVIVENSGFGSTWAVPISVLMIEKYLKGKISKEWVEKKMIEGNLIEDIK
ncbi:MAG: penicillin-binding protein 2 [Bacteroidota bacterium]|nr:penicillin-binding protein 2 [Bacteroidota bacterium]